MAATFQWMNDSGTQIGSPLKGTTRTVDAANNDWKNSGVESEPYSDHPITAGANSYTVFHFAKWSGSFNEVLNGKWAHTAGTLGSNLTLKGVVTSTYATPTTTTNAALIEDMTSEIAIGSGQDFLFSTYGPEDASPDTSITSEGYSQYLATQLQTAVGAAPGDIASVTLSVQWDEN